MVTGLSLGKYKNFLHFVKERIQKLNNYEIELNYGDEFSCSNILGNYFNIDVVAVLDNRTNDFTNRYFNNNEHFDNMKWIESYYNEYFCLLHEIGHILTSNTKAYYNYSNDVKTIKGKEYNTHYEAYKTYRNIEAEKLADNFALDFTTKYFYEIADFFTGLKENKINDFLGILN